MFYFSVGICFAGMQDIFEAPQNMYIFMPVSVHVVWKIVLQARLLFIGNTTGTKYKLCV